MVMIKGILLRQKKDLNPWQFNWLEWNSNKTSGKSFLYNWKDFRNLDMDKLFLLYNMENRKKNMS